jgi:ABC-type multidrug transport system ATPase subunit
VKVEVETDPQGLPERLLADPVAEEDRLPARRLGAPDREALSQRARSAEECLLRDLSTLHLDIHPDLTARHGHDDQVTAVREAAREGRPRDERLAAFAVGDGGVLHVAVAGTDLPQEGPRVQRRPVAAAAEPPQVNFVAEPAAKHVSSLMHNRCVPAVRVEGVAKRFRGRPALSNVSLSVSAGQVLAIFGQNGAGKSTLLRIIAGLLAPDGGSVLAAGIDVIADPVRARTRVGLLIAEERSHYWRLSGRANLEFFGALHGLRRPESRARTRLLLGEVGLDGDDSRPVGTWSTGMRMRLSIARALIGDPDVLLLDEPTRSVDPVGAEELRRLLLDVQARRTLTMLIATHDVRDPQLFDARSVVLHDGVIRAGVAKGASQEELAELLREVPAR